MKTIHLVSAVACLAIPAAGMAQTVEEGKAVFESKCIYCHGPGKDMAGTMQLARTRGEDKALLAERHDLAPEYIEYVVRHGLRAMPPFVPADVTREELQALIAYLTR